MALTGCPSRAAVTVTEAERAAIASAVEATWANMMAGGRALDPDRIRAGYIDRPVVVINGRIIDDFDRDQFDETRRWRRSLRQFDASYDHVHLEVLSPGATVATMNHHLTWTDSTGTSGQWNSAWTAVFRLVDGRWKIAYSHESTPQPAER
jgi:ketosteroid isomerase-like protein